MCDSELIQRLAAGDAEAERAFVKRFSGPLHVTVRCKGGLAQEADDVVQEVFLRVLSYLRKNGGIDSPERLPAFVQGVCRRVLFELFRARAKHPTLASDPEDRPEIPDELPTPEGVVINEESKARVREVLESLAPKDKEILRRIFFEDRDRSEVCEEMGVTPTHLRVILYRAKVQFRRAWTRAAQA